MKKINIPCAYAGERKLKVCSVRHKIYLQFISAKIFADCGSEMFRLRAATGTTGENHNKGIQPDGYDNQNAKMTRSSAVQKKCKKPISRRAPAMSRIKIRASNGSDINSTPVKLVQADTVLLLNTRAPLQVRASVRNSHVAPPQHKPPLTSSQVSVSIRKRASP